MVLKRRNKLNLKKEIEKLKEELSSKTIEESKKIMREAADNLLDLKIQENALKVGEQLPEFELKNAVGKNINIYEILSKGPLVISFYRGSWCPYCNLELRAYQEILPQIKERKAFLVAISPESPDKSLTFSEKLALDYEILSDINNDVARKLGLVFKLDNSLIDLYKSMGIDLMESQGNSNGELAVPATYVVDLDGTVVLAYVNTDYTQRFEPEDVLELLHHIDINESGLT